MVEEISFAEVDSQREESKDETETQIKFHVSDSSTLKCENTSKLLSGVTLWMKKERKVTKLAMPLAISNLKKVESSFTSWIQ